MKIIHDPRVDAAYIFLIESVSPKEFGFNYPYDPIEVKRYDNFGFR